MQGGAHGPVGRPPVERGRPLGLDLRPDDVEADPLRSGRGDGVELAGQRGRRLVRRAVRLREADTRFPGTRVADPSPSRGTTHTRSANTTSGITTTSTAPRRPGTPPARAVPSSRDGSPRSRRVAPRPDPAPLHRRGGPAHRRADGSRPNGTARSTVPAPGDQAGMQQRVVAQHAHAALANASASSAMTRCSPSTTGMPSHPTVVDTSGSPARTPRGP